MSPKDWLARRSTKRAQQVGACSDRAAKRRKRLSCVWLTRRSSLEDVGGYKTEQPMGMRWLLLAGLEEVDCRYVSTSQAKRVMIVQRQQPVQLSTKSRLC